jgi:hypothetical protein
LCGGFVAHFNLNPIETISLHLTGRSAKNNGGEGRNWKWM